MEEKNWSVVRKNVGYLRYDSDEELDILNELYDNNPALGAIGRRIMEGMFVRLQKRMYSLLIENAETRYKNLLRDKPDFIQNIPLQFIASYLGVTSQSLSRLRRSIFN